VVTDIPRVFLHADMNECVHMIMEGTIAKNVVRLESTIYIKYIWHNKKGKPMLYVQLKKGPIWDTTSGATFLEVVIRHTCELGFYN